MLKDILIVVLVLAVFFCLGQLYIIQSNMADLYNMVNDFMALFLPGQNI